MPFLNIREIISNDLIKTGHTNYNSKLVYYTQNLLKLTPLV